ncbi:MAG TPA: MFS transporter [Gammaproteobacteria bacterium]|nr:MFS transporter [Gammaproteobacteria bacterium]
MQTSAGGRLAGAVTGYARPGYARYVLAILLLAYILSFVDRQVLNLLVVPIEHDLGINDTQMSLLQGFSFAIFYAIMGLPIARLVDARSRRGIIGLGILCWSVMTAACGLARNFWHMFFARIGVGVGEAALLPGATSLVADYFPPERHGRAMGVFATGIFLGAGVALIAGGVLLKYLSGATVALPLLGSVFSWQLVFFVVGLPGVLVALLMASVREPPRHGAALPDGGQASVPVREVARYIGQNWRTFVAHNLGFSVLSLVSYGAGAWIPTFFIRTYGWSAADAGIRFGLLALALGPFGAVAGGWLADRFAQRGVRHGKLKVGVIAALCAIVPAAAFPLVASPVLSIVLIMPFFFFVSFVWGVSPAALQELMPNRMRGQAIALYTGVLNLIGLGLGPTSIALITDYLFHDQTRINDSIAIVAVIGCLVAAVLFRGGFRHYRDSLDYLAQWNARKGTAAPAGATHMGAIE